MFRQPEIPRQLTDTNQVEAYISSWRAIANPIIDQSKKNVDAVVEQISVGMNEDQKIQLRQLVDNNKKEDLKKLLSDQPEQLGKLIDAINDRTKAEGLGIKVTDLANSMLNSPGNAGADLNRFLTDMKYYNDMFERFSSPNPESLAKTAENRIRDLKNEVKKQNQIDTFTPSLEEMLKNAKRDGNQKVIQGVIDRAEHHLKQLQKNAPTLSTPSVTPAAPSTTQTATKKSNASPIYDETARRILSSQIDKEIKKLEGEIKKSKNPPKYKTDRANILRATKTYLNAADTQLITSRLHFNRAMTQYSDYGKQKLEFRCNAESLIAKACELKGDVYTKADGVKPKQTELKTSGQEKTQTRGENYSNKMR